MKGELIMYCPKCGTPLTQDGLCPNCNTVNTVPVNKKEAKTKKISENSKNYAALLTAFLVFPASFCVALDLSIHSYDFWFGYVVGAILVIWVCAVLPALKITPAPVTALICFASFIGYISYIFYKSGHIEWLYTRALPLFILFAVFVAADVGMISSKKFNTLAILSAVSFEIGIYMIVCEATFTRALTNLHWSPIFACAFISVAAVFLAFSYVGRNKKQ